MTNKELLEKGVHFGYSKSRRHPSMRKYIFATKNKVDIFNLEETNKSLERVKDFVSDLGKNKRTVLFIGTKPEAQQYIKAAASELSLPYVTNRWIGGTITNFSEIRKRADRLLKLQSDKESGNLEKYTKKERLGFSREIVKLDNYFGGITSMKKTPDAVFVIDPKKEHLAVSEAMLLNIPIITLASSDCDISKISHAIPANDSSVTSVSYFVNEIKEAYEAGSKKA